LARLLGLRLLRLEADVVVRLPGATDDADVLNGHAVYEGRSDALSDAQRLAVNASRTLTAKPARPTGD
jgi:hypothetical protein